MHFFNFSTFLILVLLAPATLIAGDNDKTLFNNVKPKPLMSEVERKPVAKLASADKISEYIEYTKGQKRVVYIYASWCPACRNKMPKIKDMGYAKKGSVIAISIDENHVQFSKYMNNSLRNAPFPIILNKSTEVALEKRLLRDYNIQPWNSYPEMILLDEKNQVKKQGYLNTAEVAQFLFSK